MPYEPAERNTENVQHERVRKYVDHVFGQLHDKISEAYYENQNLVIAGHNFGQLDDDQFERFHALSHDVYLLGKHRVNLYLDRNYGGYDKIPEGEYRYRVSHSEDDESGSGTTHDEVAEAQDRLRKALQNHPAIATHEFEIPDPVTDGKRTITLQHLANFNTR